MVSKGKQLLSPWLEKFTKLWNSQNDQPRHITFALRWILILFTLSVAGCQIRSDGHPVGEGQLLFTSKKNDNFDIYRIDMNGTSMTRLTSHQATDSSSAWSPDGEKIAFETLRDSDQKPEGIRSCLDLNCEIYVMNTDGSDKIRLTHSDEWSETNPSWAADGEHIAFVSYSFQDRTSMISVIDLDSSNLKHLTNHDSYAYEPAWSPNGSHIAFRQSSEVSSEGINYDIYVVDVFSSTIQQLTTHEGDDYAPTWSPDGTRIYFLSNRGEKTGIYAMDPDGRNLKELITTTYGDYNMMNVSYYASFDLSSNGQKITFASDKDGPFQWQIYVMNIDGSGTKKLTERSQSAGFPVWSPDGNQIAFLSGTQDVISYEIYIMDADGNDQRRVASGSEISWAPIQR